MGYGKLIQVDCGLSEYEQLLLPQENVSERSATQARQPIKRPASPSKTDQRREQVEQQIAALESALTVLGSEIEEAGKRADLDQITELGNRFARSQAELDGLFAEWALLSEAVK